MAEETKQNADVEETKITETVETPETKTTQEEKKFTQKELDSLIQSRVKREKESYAAKENSWTAEKQELETKVETYEKTIQNLISSQMEGLSALEKKALSKLSVLDQLDLLATATQDRVNMPITPKSKTVSNTQPKKTLGNFLK